MNSPFKLEFVFLNICLGPGRKFKPGFTGKDFVDFWLRVEKEEKYRCHFWTVSPTPLPGVFGGLEV